MIARIDFRTRTISCALAMAILMAVAFAAFGHIHAGPHTEHFKQPCAACAAMTLLATGLLAAAAILGVANAREVHALILVQAPSSRPFAHARSQRAPPVA